MKAIILDTETHKLNGLPIEIAYMPCVIVDRKVKAEKEQIFQKYYSCGEPIELGAMAVHHILESEIEGQPHCSTFKLPPETIYMIGHNIDYDIKSLNRAGTDTKQIKAICTLALARKLWPDLDSHTLSALSYYFAKDKEKIRNYIRGAHSAAVDIMLTAGVLNQIIQKLAVKDLNSFVITAEAIQTPSIMSFGKHKGVPIVELPKDYVHYMLGRNDLDQFIRKALEQVA
nr:3'-5' exonuclease [Acinetobacter oleivorans]